MSVHVPTSPICGCLSCHEPAVAIVDHPSYGRRAVCDGHAQDFEVIERV